MGGERAQFSNLLSRLWKEKKRNSWLDISDRLMVWVYGSWWCKALIQSWMSLPSLMSSFSRERHDNLRHDRRPNLGGLLGTRSSHLFSRVLLFYLTRFAQHPYSLMHIVGIGCSLWQCQDRKEVGGLHKDLKPVPAVLFLLDSEAYLGNLSENFLGHFCTLIL